MPEMPFSMRDIHKRTQTCDEAVFVPFHARKGTEGVHRGKSHFPLKIKQFSFPIFFAFPT